MLERDKSVLLLIDVQGKLAGAMAGCEALLQNLSRLVRGARLLSLPVLWTEQVPEKLGPTRPELAPDLAGLRPVAKSAFSCCGEPGFSAQLEALDRAQVLVCGIEAHVCVYQTVLDLLDAGYEVQVVRDAVSSRSPSNREAALERMAAEGARLTTVEMTLFELQRSAGGETFRDLLQILK